MPPNRSQFKPGCISDPNPVSDSAYRSMVGAALDLFDQGMTVFDASLRLVAWNARFVELLEFPDTLLQTGTPYEDFVRHNVLRGEYGPVPETDIDAWVSERMALARKLEAHHTRWIRPNGRVLELRGEPLAHAAGFVTFYADITDQQHRQDRIERDKAELEAHIQSRTAELTRANAELTAAIERNHEITVALRYSEGRLRQITDTIPAHIAYFDHGWAYRYANRRYAQWFGWTADTIVDQAIPKVIGARLFDQIAEDVRRALDGAEVSYEYSITGSDGIERYARSTLLPDFSPSGQVLGCFVHAVDITEQKRTQSVLAQAQKMEAIGELTGGLAHDFNNMLTVVTGNLNELREARPDDAIVDEYIGPALHAAERSAGLIRRLLAFARQQPLSPRPVAMDELIDGLNRLLLRSVPENIRVETEIGQPLPVALADPHQLESALLNLTLNARDAMPRGGLMRIETDITELSASDAAAMEMRPGPYVQISVRDNGEGMDGGTLARVFEPFFTTKKASRGSGLGMAMVYGFVKQSGGGIRIRSRQAVGTTVSLLLPCADPADLRIHDLPVSSGDPADWLRDRLVLLVEDDPEVRRVVRKQLAALDCAVLEAHSGEDAADMLETISSISLIVSDVVMPGSMDGHALARFARSFRPELPVILMSGYTDAAESITGDLALPILPKPFTREALYAALARLVPFMPGMDADAQPR